MDGLSHESRRVEIPLEGDGRGGVCREKIAQKYLGVPLDTPEKDAFHVGRIKNDNLLLRFEFMARFFQSAGYARWVILLDEADLAEKEDGLS